MNLVSRFLARHPSLRETLWWVMPALVFGGLLRLMFLHYSPYAYWGSDSRSYYDFTHKLFVEHRISLDEKRRLLYPLLMAAVTALPGPPLQWVAWLQHGFGLVTLIPMGYVVRKSFRLWHWWIIPITVLYAGLPVVLWYEHELLAETLFFAFVVWAFAGWIAWSNESRVERSGRLWWCFFIPFALFIVTKPSGRFYWPGLLLGIVLVGAWRRMRSAHFASVGVLMAVTLLLGSKVQGAWLLYVASFPLTQLDSPLHAEYKAQIRDLVENARNDLHIYYTRDDEPFEFTRNARLHPERTLWAALEDNHQERSRIHMDLALEGIVAEPLTFLYLGVQRAVVSANLSTFRTVRFEADSMPNRFRDDYEAAMQRVREGRRTPIPLVLGLPIRGPLPPFPQIAARLSPKPESSAANFVLAWVNGYCNSADVVWLPPEGTLFQLRPKPLGIWLLAGVILAFKTSYRPIFGVWTLAALGYLAGVFLVSQVNPRYFGAAWPVLIPILALPADVICQAIKGKIRKAQVNLAHAE